jgi:hypothetical protein
MTRKPRGDRDATEVLLEAATSAFRARAADSGRVEPSPAWWDLGPVERDELFARQMASRILEQSLDALGLSTTARSVMRRLPWINQLGES